MIQVGVPCPQTPFTSARRRRSPLIPSGVNDARCRCAMTLPVSANLRARILDYHAKGVGRNDIARLTGVSTASVSKIVKDTGGSFDTTQTESATRNRVADLAEMRSRLAFRLIAKAHDLVDDMDAEYRAFSFGGKDNTFASETLDRPTPDAIRALMVSAGQAVKSSMELSKFDTDPNEGLSAVDEWLAQVTGTSSP